MAPVDAAVLASAPVLTAEVFVVPLDAGDFLVYAPLRQAAFVANARSVNVLASVQDGSFDPSSDPGGAFIELLRRLEIVDGGVEHPPTAAFGGDPEPTLVTLFLTTACNLRCTYCYASAGDTPTRTMSLDVALRGIEYVASNAARLGTGHFDVIYHGGGEPTVNWSVITDSLTYARTRADELGLTVSATGATNGVLSDSQIDWIVGHLDGVSLSFDGLPEVHDRHRLTVLGQGSSERVIHTMRRFDDASFRYGVRVTVTADQIARLPDSIAYICANFSPGRIQVEPAYQIGRWSESPSAETAEFIAAFRAAQVRARTFGREITYSAARIGTLTNHFCGITQDSFALSPDGNVSACYEVFSEENPRADTFFYGRPSPSTAGYVFDLPVLNGLRAQTVDRRAWCDGCFARWTCAGDCFHKSLTVNGDSEFRGSDRCNITRELTKDQLLDRIVASGGLFWHEPPGRPGSSAAGKEILL